VRALVDRRVHRLHPDARPRQIGGLPVHVARRS
jgi:hypothetical protein